MQASLPPLQMWTRAADPALPPSTPVEPAIPTRRTIRRPTRERRLAWAVLPKRSWGLDVLDCPRCHSRKELIAAIEDPAIAERILRQLKLPPRAPPRGRPGVRSAPSPSSA